MDDDEREAVDWIHQIQDRNKWNTSINTAMILLLHGNKLPSAIQGREF